MILHITNNNILHLFVSEKHKYWGELVLADKIKPNLKRRLPDSKFCMWMNSQNTIKHVFGLKKSPKIDSLSQQEAVQAEIIARFSIFQWSLK